METTNKRPEWLTISFTDHFCHHLNTLAATHLVHLQHNFLQNRSSKYIYYYTTDIRDRSRLVVLSGSWFWKQSSVPISTKLEFNEPSMSLWKEFFLFCKTSRRPKISQNILGSPVWFKTRPTQMNSWVFPNIWSLVQFKTTKSTENELSKISQNISSLVHLKTQINSKWTLKISQNISNLVQLKTQINSKWAHSQDFPKHLEPGPVGDTDQQQVSSLSRLPKTFGTWSSWRHRSTASELTLKTSQNIWNLVQLETQINSKWTHSQDFPKHLKPSPVEDTDQQQTSFKLHNKFLRH